RELLARRVGQDLGQHDVPGARDVAALPFPALADVDDLMALVKEPLHLVDVGLTESALVVVLGCHLFQSSSPDQSPRPHAPTFNTFRESSAHLIRAGEMSMPR